MCTLIVVAGCRCVAPGAVPNLVPHPEPGQWSLTIHTSSTPYTRIMTGTAFFRSTDGGVPGMDVLGFPATDSAERYLHHRSGERAP